MEGLNINTYLTIISTTVAFFIFLNESINSQIKKRIANWLQNIKPNKPNDNWPKHFIEVFDSIFSKKHFSFYFFCKSCLFSLLWIILLLLIWYFIHPNQIKDFWISEQFYRRTALLFSGILLVNILADYFSLLETRFMLKYLSKNYSKGRLIQVIILDIIFTFLIFIIITLLYFKCIYFRYLVLDIAEEGAIRYIFSSEVVYATLCFDVIEKDWFSTSPVFYSVFFTSIWLWVYAISGFFIKLFHIVKHNFSLSIIFFDIEQKPFYYISFVAIMVESLIYICYLVFTSF